MSQPMFQWLCAGLFVLALVHTFSTKYFEHLAHQHPAHAGLWHWLGEVEVVFGFWALILVVVMAVWFGLEPAKAYVESRNYTEPMFVFVVMVVAATRPILQLANGVLSAVARALPLPAGVAHFGTVMLLVPLMGSLITEPAAMTLAALLLGQRYFAGNAPLNFKYATLGVLFVNVSIGGTMTSFAAPPVLMVAGAWGWDTAFMMQHFGWKAAVAVLVNTAALTLWYRQVLVDTPPPAPDAEQRASAPAALVVVHALFLLAVVVFAHYPAIFMALFIFFLGIAQAYQTHQDRLILKEGLLVAFFLGGLVVLGGQQQWWLQPLLMSLSSEMVFVGALVLTAATDNAALTYLGSLVEGLSDAFKYSLVAGAVAGGGLTIVANAPNPAGVAILRVHFDEQTVSPVRLLVAALLPTAVAAACLWYL